MKQPPEQWDFYLTDRLKSPASIAVNLGLKEIAPDESRPWRLDVLLFMKHPRDDGLVSAHERPEMDAIEDHVVAAAAQIPGALFVGRMITAGCFHVVVYAPASEGLEAAVDSAMSAFPDHEFDRRVSADPEWKFLRKVLWPTKEEYQWIMNRRVLENLQREGDDLQQRREVSHWLYFPHPFARSECLKAIAHMNFAVREDDRPDDGSGRLRFCATLAREDSVQLRDIHQVVMDLVFAAEEAGGQYDGWETKIIKPAPTG